MGEGGGAQAFENALHSSCSTPSKDENPSHVTCSMKGFLSYGAFVHIWFALHAIRRTYGTRRSGGPHIDST